MAVVPEVAALVQRGFRTGAWRWAGAILLVAGVTGGCARAPEAPAVRLTEVFDASRVEGSTPRDEGAVRRTEWGFEGPPSTPAPGARSTPAPAASPGWEAGPGISGLVVRDGMLLGRTTSDAPILRLTRTTGLDDADQLHAVEIRLRVSKGANLFVGTRPGDDVDLRQEARQVLVAEDEPHGGDGEIGPGDVGRPDQDVA